MIACPDVLAPAIPAILASLRAAPRVRVEFLSARGVGALGAADLAVDILPEDAPGVVARRLGRVTQVVIARRGHPAVDAWGLDAWCAWPHVLVRTADAGRSPIEAALARAGRERAVGLVLSDLLTVPHVVAATDLLFTGPREVLALLAGPLGLALLEPPVPLAPVPVAALWEERYQADPGHAWLRERVAAPLVAMLGG